LTAGDEPRRADWERNRRQLTETSIELLATDPELSIQQIADASGIGRTTVYRHFKNRDELLEAVIAEVMARARRTAAAAAVIPGDPERSIRNLSAALIGIALSYGRLIASCEGESEAFEAAKDAPDSPTWIFLTEARARGELRGELPQEWMRTVMQTVTLTAVAEVDAGTIDEAEAQRVAADTLVAILLPD